MGLDITFDNSYHANQPLETPAESALPQRYDMLLNQPILMPQDSTPFSLPEPTKGMSFFKTFEQAAIESNDVVAGFRLAQQAIHNQNPLSQDRPDGWSPHHIENYLGIDQKYWPMIDGARNPQDLQNILNDIHKRMKQDEEYENGSWIAKLSGSVVGGALSPLNLIPIAGVLKYGRSSEYVLKNLMRVAPGIATQSLAHNMLLDGANNNLTLENLAVGTLADTTFGLALVGGGLGLGSVLRGSEVYAARKALKMSYDGIEPKRILTKDGIDTGRMQAVPARGMSVSAAKVNDAQQFLDSGLARQGIFKMAAASKMFSTINPVVRGLTSPFSKVRTFTNLVADHSLTTEGELRGEARPDNFEEKTWYFRSRTKLFQQQLNGLWHEANGIKPGLSTAMGVKALKQRLDGSRMYSKEGFGKEVINTIITGELNTNKSINEAAELTRQHLDETYGYFRKQYGLSDKWLSPRTAANYFMRSYDHDALITNEQGWRDLISGKLKQQDEQIASVMQPLQEAQNELAGLKSFHEKTSRSKSATDSEIKQSAERIQLQHERIRQEKRRLAETIENDESLRKLIEDPTALTVVESDELKNLMQKHTELMGEFEKARDDVSLIKKQISRARSSRQKAKTKKTAAKHTKTIDELTSKLDDMQTHADKLQIAARDEYANLSKRAQRGEINKNLFTKNPETGRIHFKDPNDLVKLRKQYESHDARIEHAEQYRNVILNHTPEQLSDHVLGGFVGNIKENPIKSRRIMIDDADIYNAGFLNTDIDTAVAAYDSFLTKRGAMKEVFNDITLDGGIDDLIKGVAEEYQQQNKLLDLIENKATRDKAKRQLKKDFNKAKEFMSHTYDAMMGRTGGSESLRHYASMVRSFAALTKLGSVALTMVVEPMSIVMKHGMWPTLRDGILPWLKTVGGVLKTPEGIHYRENAAHALIATEHLLNGYANKMWNPDAVGDVPLGGRVGSAIEKMSHVAGNISGTNHLDNLFQRWSASVVQSKIMNAMEKFMDGTLSEKERLMLLHAGLKPEDWAERFVGEWKKAGSDKNGLGGYMSHYYNWEDAVAANKMSQAIRRGVRDTILKRGLLSSPFWSNNPIAGFALLFKGWAFEALTRYTLPAMQRPDATKLLGMMMMLGVGALVDPFRRIARGEDPVRDDDNLFWSALTNSGVLGVLTDFAQDANVVAGGLLFQKFGMNDKYRNRSIMGVLGGPAGGIADDLTRIIHMVGSGQFNEHDTKKMARLIPFSQVWQMQYFTNKMVESLGLPQTAADARQRGNNPLF